MDYKLWDKENKEFLEDDWETEYAVLANGTVIEIQDNCFGEGYSVRNLDNIEVLQFTGLKDKNGKEIYEGDIIRLKHHIDKRINVVGKVVFLSEQASFGIIDDLCQEYPLFRNTTEQIEIIGNIYENFELLEGKDDKER